MSPKGEDTNYVALEEAVGMAEQEKLAFDEGGRMFKYLRVTLVSCAAVLAMCTLAWPAFFSAAPQPIPQDSPELPIVEVYDPFDCKSPKHFGQVHYGANKGLALDDESFVNCTSLLPEHWPNTDEPIRSLRLFMSWRDKFQERRIPAYKVLSSYARRNNARVLVGTQITCNDTDDDRDWEQALELMQMLGPEHIMGVAIGNELDILWAQADKNFPKGPCLDHEHYRRAAITTSANFNRACGKHECLKNLWHGGGFWTKFQRRVNDLDRLGFQSVPLTSVFGAYALAGHADYSFSENSGALVDTFLKNVTRIYSKERWVFTFNFYGYFDPNACANAQDSGECCNTVLENDVCFNCDGNGKGFVPAVVRLSRAKIFNITGQTGWKLWIGETGWSSPISDTLWDVNHYLGSCTHFSSEAAYAAYYKNFLKWDLSIGGNLSAVGQDHMSAEGADHVFWFSLRDSYSFKIGEHFGLMSTCHDTQCKLK